MREKKKKFYPQIQGVTMTELEKIVYIVIMASCKLRHYFEAHKVRVNSDWGFESYSEIRRRPLE